MFSWQARFPGKRLSFGRKIDPDHANAVVHDQVEDDADARQVPLHIQLEGSIQDLARHDRHHSNRHQPRGRAASPLETRVTSTYF